MTIYRFFGGFPGASVFGVVLDLGGGNQSGTACGLAFASIGVFGVLAPVVRFFYLRIEARR